MPTKIEWCDEVWNPVTGCDPISEGCDHCYARRMACRLQGRFGYPSEAPFRVTFHPDRLDIPLKWKTPRRIFVNSMGDLFHEAVDDEWIKKVFNAMATDILQPCLHTYLILTKRPKRMAAFFAANTKQGTLPWLNVWLGVTAENQARADERIPILLSIPAAVHFVSVEPMLGPVDLETYLLSDADKAAHEDQLLEPIQGFNYRKLNWVIAGPETGPGKRKCKNFWINHLWLQCGAAGVPFFDKRKTGWQAREWPK